MGKRLFVFGEDDEKNGGFGFDMTLSRKDGISFTIWGKKSAIEFREPFLDLGED
jgi:hypothetical protein